AGNPPCTLSGTASTTSPAATTCTVSIPAGEQVAFVATPVSDADFVGWEGCASITASCLLATLVDAAVTASFEPTPLVLTVRSVGGSGSGMVSSRPTAIACAFVGSTVGGTCSAPFA